MTFFLFGNYSTLSYSRDVMTGDFVTESIKVRCRAKTIRECLDAVDEVLRKRKVQ